MPSFTKITWTKRLRKRRRIGHKRKVALAQKSTESYQELFATLGEPGQPAPKQSS